MRLTPAVRISLILVLVFAAMPVVADTSTTGLPAGKLHALQARSMSDTEIGIRVDPGQIEFFGNWTCNSDSCDGNVAHNINEKYPAGTVTFVSASATRGSCIVATSVRVECDFGTVALGDDATVTMVANHSGGAELFLFDYTTDSGFDSDRMMIISPYTTGVDLIANGGFETAGDQKSIPQFWKVTNLAKRKCNQPDKIIAFAGDCAVQIKGLSGISSKLVQNVDVPAGIAGEDAFWLEMQINAKNLTKPPVITVKWDAGIYGTARAKLSAPTISGSYTLINRQAKFFGAPIGIKVQLIYKGNAGKAFIDQCRLYYVNRSAYF